LKNKKTAFIGSFFSHVSDRNRHTEAPGVGYSENKRTFLDRESLFSLRFFDGGNIIKDRFPTIDHSDQSHKKQKNILNPEEGIMAQIIIV
jgi:hypothetical protein